MPRAPETANARAAEGGTLTEHLHHWTEVNPTLELELDRRLRPDARGPLPLEVLEALDTKHGAAANAAFVGAWESIRAAQVRPELYQKALQLADELEAEGPALVDWRNMRHAVASYLEADVLPYSLRVDGGEVAKEYGVIAGKLRDARPIGAYGVDVDSDERADLWTNKAGLVKLCPQDARAESQRASKRYGRALAELDERGYVLRYAVFTLPNFPQWHLAAGIDAIYDRFKQTILYARTDGRVARSIRDPKRKFPDLVGAWACLEAPLSRMHSYDPSNAWNVHLNLLLVFKPSEELTSYRTVYGRAVPDYSPIHDAWGAGIDWSEIPQGDRDAMRKTIAELVKYPLQTVASKSAEHARRRASDGGERGPPMIQWPPEFFCEWWRAHKGFRRARSWGVLYNLPDEHEERDLKRVDWFGSMRVTPTELVVQRPAVSTVVEDRATRKREFAHRALLSIDPGYRAAVARRETDARDRERNLRAREAARERLFLIQGNISAKKHAEVVGETLRAARGPP